MDAHFPWLWIFFGPLSYVPAVIQGQSITLPCMSSWRAAHAIFSTTFARSFTLTLFHAVAIKPNSELVAIQLFT
jgi:hypothetical protein